MRRILKPFSSLLTAIFWYFADRVGLTQGSNSISLPPSDCLSPQRSSQAFCKRREKKLTPCLKKAAISLWKHSIQLSPVVVGSVGKISKARNYSLVYSITSEISAGIQFKFVVQTDITATDLEFGVEAFVELIDDLHHGRVSEENVRALLTYKPVGGTVLVTFDVNRRMIVPVNAFGPSDL